MIVGLIILVSLLAYIFTGAYVAGYLEGSGVHPTDSILGGIIWPLTLAGAGLTKMIGFVWDHVFVGAYNRGRNRK